VDAPPRGTAPDQPINFDDEKILTFITPFMANRKE
jgi:hypothetical protein